ncbi:hypothetical protein F8271_07225 [Micromonospora sp. ALFpr18c]|uniref:hypothetical protein n=1 Tax=unclassified Micromonospora TaxID=2617518 RepID=UPI00124B6903|nr:MULTISPECIES: hypothetical protein [unclassified Micromonospora]KAB1946249.1 hypothetical protein F8271_07225 [Micromonospora sp. ALFpr18c]MDG4759247.1 hypothetical protein [Micromonospora sp. WMMD710]
MATVWRNALRVGVVLAGLTGVVPILAAPAQAAFATEMSGLPARFTAGGQVRTISAVVSQTDRRGGCAKVRWSMVLSVQGIRLDQVKMDRVEESGDFPLEVRTEGDVARLTDRQLDPGTLCPGRTVTARYRVAFDEDVTQGRVTLAAEAYDANLRLLARQTATRSVVGAGATPTGAAQPSATPAPPSDPASEPAEAEDTPSEEPVADQPVDAAPPADGRPVAQTGGFGVVQAAFLLGGLLLSLGVGLLLRLRHLTRAATNEAEDPPVDRRWERPAPPGRWRPARR